MATRHKFDIRSGLNFPFEHCRRKSYIELAIEIDPIKKNPKKIVLQKKMKTIFDLKYFE